MELKKRFDAYIKQGLEPMLKSAGDGSFEGVIAQETDYTRKLDDAYNEVLFKAIKLRTERSDGLNEQAAAQTRLGFIMMAAAFGLALLLTLATFIFLRRVVITPLRQAVE